ncbi:MAG: hypothetical protein C5B54_09215, partial [Acidobacteria bacterium]
MANLPRQQKQQTGDVRDLIERQTSQFALLMSGRPDVVDRFKRIIFTTIQDNPDLRRCDPQSILSVCMHAAQDGLMLDGREAAMVPYKSEGR